MHVGSRSSSWLSTRGPSGPVFTTCNYPPHPPKIETSISQPSPQISPSWINTHTRVLFLPSRKKTNKLPSAFSPLIQSVCVIGPLTHSASVPPARGLLSIFILPFWHENATTLRLVLDHWRFMDECVFVCECESIMWDVRSSSFPSWNWVGLRFSMMTRQTRNLYSWRAGEGGEWV